MSKVTVANTNHVMAEPVFGLFQLESAGLQ